VQPVVEDATIVDDWSAIRKGLGLRFSTFGARVRKSRQKEAAGAADAGHMQIEWSEAEVLKLPAPGQIARRYCHGDQLQSPRLLY
jgi:hypothetical protein